MWWWSALGVALVSLGVRAAATEAQEATEPRRVEPVVITATKVETPASELGASVSVVPEEDFKTYHYLTLGTSLRPVPGVDIRQSGSFGKVTSISIRGATANQVQVLVDGVRVKSPTLGQVDLSDLSPDVIDRVEVLRGPQSTLYGADAIGGVVNVITRRGRGPFTLSLEQTVGTDDAYVSRGSLGGQWKALDYSLGGSWASSAGQFPNDDATQAAVNGQVGLSLPWDSRIAFIVRWNRTETGLPVKFVSSPLPEQPVIDPNAQQQSETLVMSLTGQTRPLPWWESRLRLSLYKNNLDFQDPLDPGLAVDFGSESETDVRRREVEWLNLFHVGKWSTTTIGLEYRDEKGQNTSDFSSFSARYQIGSVFLEEQWRPIEGLFVTGGFRVEDNSLYGTDVTGRGGVSYAIKPWGTRLHASVGSGFRAPTLNDLFFPGFSNPDLQPERSLSWDIGVEQRLWGGRIRLGLTYFWNDFDNLIQPVGTSVPPFFVTVVNVASARSSGVELTAEVDILPTLVATGSYTFTNTEDLDTGLPLPRQPKNRGYIGLTWEPLPRLSLFGQLYLVSKQFESAAAGYTPGYVRLDVGGTFRVVSGYRWLQALDLTTRIQNLLDSDYAEVRGFPAPGIQAFLGLRATF